MSRCDLTPSVMRLAKDDVATALPWKSVAEVVKKLGSVQVEIKVPETLDGMSKPVWSWMLTMEAVKHGLMAIRDGYGDNLTFHPIIGGTLDGIR